MVYKHTHERRMRWVCATAAVENLACFYFRSNKCDVGTTELPETRLGTRQPCPRVQLLRPLR